MAAISSIIETGVDKLVKLVKERARISMEDAAKELGISERTLYRKIKEYDIES